LVQSLASSYPAAIANIRMVRSHAGISWAALRNTRHRHDTLAHDLDRLLWAMVGKVARWRT